MNFSLRLLFLLLFIPNLTGCLTARPEHVANICKIFQEYPKWYWAADASEKRWKVPISVMMAVIHQESRFDAGAKPDRTRLLWIIPWKRPSSAYGYSQALNGTWKIYQRQTGRHSAKRDKFGNAIDFIGWYLNRIHRKLKIPAADTYRLYLAYHEGTGNYARGSFRRKSWLLKVAAKVKHRSWAYQAQLNKCRADLKRKPWYHFW